MPVYLQSIQQPDDADVQSVVRVCDDLSADHLVSKRVQQWQDARSEFDLYGAMFNERMVGFVLLQGNEIKAFAVHGATRRRGVGQRMLDELIRLNPDVRGPDACSDEWLQRHFKSCD